MKNKQRKIVNTSEYRQLPFGYRLWQLFLSTLCISAVAFGGGFVVLPMLKRTFVDKFSWLTDDEMRDTIAIAQSSPGTIAGNTAMVIGFRVAGILGACVTMLASIIPPLVIITGVYYAYSAIISSVIARRFLGGMLAGVGAVIIDFTVRLIKDFKNEPSQIFALLVLAGAFSVSTFTSLSVIYVVLIAIALGIALCYYLEYVKRKHSSSEIAVKPYAAQKGTHSVNAILKNTAPPLCFDGCNLGADETSILTKIDAKLQNCINKRSRSARLGSSNDSANANLTDGGNRSKTCSADKSRGGKRK